MVFRLVQTGNALPFSFPLDPTCSFQAGQIAQLGVIGNNVVCGVSDGLAPIGVIDDVKTKAFSAPSINETVRVTNLLSFAQNGRLLFDIKAELENPNVIPESFVTDPLDVELIPRNGVVVFLAGTELNLDADGDGTPDSVVTTVNYTYQVPNIIGDDSTAGSNRITVWFNRFIGETDQFETNQQYPLNANLFVSEHGLLTTRQPTVDHPSVALVTGPPGPIASSLQFLWL